MSHLDITGRHVEITPALRSFTAEKLGKLERLLDEALDIHVVLGIEKHRHFAEVQVKSRTGVFSGHHETGDLYASISEVADKLERQALKHKQKMQDHKHRRGPRDPQIAATIEANVTAEIAPASNGQSAPRTPRLVQRRSYRLKPMAIEDAVMELDASGEELLLFRLAENDRVCAVYRQKDGDLAWVLPEF